MADSAIVERARELARRAHVGQSDKAGSPYIGHCERVAAKLDTDEARVVAFLHDVLEDTSTSEGELREAFGDRIIDAVVLLTRREGVDAPEYYAGIKSDPLALSVKLADIHDNVEPRRLSLLDPETRSWLLRKYGAALQALGT